MTDRDDAVLLGLLLERPTTVVDLERALGWRAHRLHDAWRDSTAPV